MNKLQLSGVFPPMVTPFKENGDVDYQAFIDNIEKWNHTGLSGYLVLGSNSETCYLSMEEKEELIRLTVKHSLKDKHIMAGTGLESIRETIEFTNRAARLGAQSALVLTCLLYTSITVAVNKEIISLCTSDNKKALKNITESITEYEYGKWKPFVLEKSMRIIYILTYLIKLLVPSGKKIFWMPDDDATMANERRAVDLTRMLSNALNSLKDAPKYKTIGYSMKPFNTDASYYMTCLLYTSRCV